MTETPQPSESAAPLVPPGPLPRRRGRDLVRGIDILPAKRLQAFSDEELELLVEHWLYETMRDRYETIIKYGGAGDRGRDVAGYEHALGSNPWDNYQCKQYDKKLQPTDLWLELGKLVYYVAKGEYTVPRLYAIVAPKGIGPKALDYLADPEKLRAGLRANWTRYCSSLCTKDAIESALTSFVFPPFAPILAGRIIDDLKDTPSYPYFFGGGLTKPRPADTMPPEEIAKGEMPYVTQLVAVYDEHCSDTIDSPSAAMSRDPYATHLSASRREFYCADSLREFSKDAFHDSGTFAELQTLMHDGVRHVVALPHPSGYERVLRTCAQAIAVQLGDHPLAPEVNPADRAGICHQLANDDRVQWLP